MSRLTAVCALRQMPGDLAKLKTGVVVRENAEIRAVGVKGLTTYEAYQPPPEEKSRRGPKPTLNAVVVTRWKGQDVPEEEQVVLITSLPVDDPLRIVELYRKTGGDGEQAPSGT